MGQELSKSSEQNDQQLAEESDRRRQSNAEWVTIYNRSSKCHEPQLAEESDKRRQSHAEWVTIYNRSSECHEPQCLQQNRQRGNDGSQRKKKTRAWKMHKSISKWVDWANDYFEIPLDEEGLKEFTTMHEARIRNDAEMMSHSWDPSMGAKSMVTEESEDRRESSAERFTIFNRVSECERHDPIGLATDAIHAQIESGTNGYIFMRTRCIGTQTEMYPIPEEYLDLVCNTMVRELQMSSHQDSEQKVLFNDQEFPEDILSILIMMLKSTNTDTDKDLDSSVVNDTISNQFMQIFAGLCGITLEAHLEGFSELKTMHQAQMPNEEEMGANRRESFGTTPAMDAQLMTQQITRTQSNHDVTVADKSASVIPRQTVSRDTQTESCNQFDREQESLKEIGRRMAPMLTKRNSLPLLKEFLQMSINEIFELVKTCLPSCLPSPNEYARYFATNVEILHSSSEVDTDETHATDGMRTQTALSKRLNSIAEEIANVLEFYTGDVTLMNMRNIPGCEQRNVKLIELMGISPGDCSVMDIDHNNECGENEHTNSKEKITSNLSKLIKGHLGERRLRDDKRNARNVSERNVTQSTEEAHHTYEYVSLATSVALSCIGYGPDIRKQRIERYRKFNRRCTGILFGWMSFLISGSKSEGLTRLFESDIDAVYLVNSVICYENCNHASGIHINETVLIMETDDCCPGYCRLVLERNTSLISSIIFSLSRSFFNDGTGKLFLSSDVFRSEAGRWLLNIEDHIPLAHAGPSLPFCIQNLHVDRVVALRCRCPSILNRWAERPRHWPPPDVVQKVVSLEAFVTPVGFKGSKSNNLEWRLCFNTAEIELVVSLNDTQTKLYVLLKMIVKDLLKPRRKEITSFMVKSIVFWLAEKNQQTLFHERSLLHWLHNALGELRTAIASKNLSYYMIPDRNLMAACTIENEQQRVWVKTLTEMMNEGPMVILRLEKIRKAIISCPEPLFWYNKIRTEFEMLLFAVCRNCAQVFASGALEAYLQLCQGTDKDSKLDTSAEILIRLDEIIQEVHERLNKEGFWFYDKYELIVRIMR